MQTVRAALSGTDRSVRIVLTRLDTFSIVGGVTTLYTVIYLYSIGHLFPAGRGFGMTMVADPLSRMVQASGTFLWEPIARIDLWSVGYLLSPLNTGLGLLLGILVGLNVGLAYLAWRQPKACGISAGSGLLAAIPGLLSGSACCAPLLLLALGIQASGILLVALQIALPAGIVLLLGTLLYVGKLTAPARPTQ